MAVSGFEEPLSCEPSRLRAGDFVSWRRDDLARDFPPDDLTLSYVGTLEGEAPEKIEFTATAENGGFLVSISGDDSSTWTSGAYQWAAFITRKSDGARKTVGSGRFEVLPDLASGDAIDLRSHNRRMLEQIEALLEGRAKSGVASYEIAGRKLTKLTPKELADWHTHYRKLVRIEDRKRTGRGSHRLRKVEFK
ncbi:MULTISPECIES: hypothetical protein [unclassified Pseudovibrio]|uniref:hypothetical protein n=1 Tax=unclassified Pseudovibrio TaxID=2627060 RepID=UPI0007AE831F|nr:MULTISPECIES: hypothetical protein [unclassified Pseudovibrio]KZL00447.1 hypothetical protein PsW74_02872 [Pseudovibrio sp. W74]KZL07447.1 hypothetical protein PsAD14_03832 [Pseudovibrio sp. Ad14]